MRVLFITYDGLLDPLGGSQILPYLMDIAKHQASLHILSFEKSDKYTEGANALRNKLTENNISWTPLLFTRRFGKFGKLYDLFRMYAVALKLQLKSKFEIIHCRSYQAMQVGCFLKSISKAKVIFDMRGLWVDDRVEGGLWPQNVWINRLIYKWYKRHEKKMLVSADHVVVLTNRVVPEIRNISPMMTAQITVIPCCADFNHFTIRTSDDQLRFREELGIDPQSIVLSYLGSLGTVYLFEDMIRLFAVLSRARDDVHLLIITMDWQEKHENILEKLGAFHLRSRVHIKPATRAQVPIFLSISDIMLSFRKDSYSQIACSPTKLAEAFALGIPVISNASVGDVDQITNDLDSGLIVDLTGEASFETLTFQLGEIIAKGGIALRDRARKQFGLEVASSLYKDVYRSLERTE